MPVEPYSARDGQMYQMAIDVAAKACDRRTRIGQTGTPSNVIRECRAHFVAMVDKPMVAAFDRAVAAAFKSGAASAAYDVRQLRDGFDLKELEVPDVG